MPSLRSKNVLALACVVAIGFAGGPAAAVAGTGQRAKTPDPGGLLDRFPLGTTPITTVPPALEPRRVATQRAPEPRRVATQQAPEGDEALGVALSIGAGAFGLLAAFAAWRVRRPSGSRERETGRGVEPIQSLRHVSLALAQQECDGPSSRRAPSANRPARRSRLVREVPQDRNQAESRPTGPGLPPVEAVGKATPGREQDYTGVGERVAGILEAAEAAAAQIRAEALASAAVLNDEAKLEASAQLRVAQEDAARLRSEAEAGANETRSAAESFGTRQRRDAEEEAGKVLAEAETQARATRQAAEGMARQIEVAAREREEALRAQLLPLEAKLRRALEGFRGISNQLEELLDGKQGGGEESLVDALGVSTRKTAAWEEKV